MFTSAGNCISESAPQLENDEAPTDLSRLFLANVTSFNALQLLKAFSSIFVTLAGTVKADKLAQPLKELAPILFTLPGKFMAESWRHLENAWRPIVSSTLLFANVTVFSAEQPLNVLLLIALTSAGIVNSFKLEQFWNAPLPIFLTSAGNCISESAPQLEKAKEPTDSSRLSFGNVTAFNFSQPAKVSSSMLVTRAGTAKADKLVQPVKAPAAILLTLSGNSMEDNRVHFEKASGAIFSSWLLSAKTKFWSIPQLEKVFLLIILTAAGSRNLERLSHALKVEDPMLLTLVGKSMKSSLLHSLKAELPIVLRILPSAKSTVFSALQPRKVKALIMVTFAGTTTLVKLTQYLKAPKPMVVTVAGKLISARFLHPENAVLPIVPSWLSFANVTLSNDLQLEKALLPMRVTVAGTMPMLRKLLQPLKAPFLSWSPSPSIVWRFWGSSISANLIHPKKAASAIVWRTLPVAKVTFSSVSQPANVLGFIIWTPTGTVKAFKLLQPSKAREFMFVTLPGNVVAVRFVQLANAEEPICLSVLLLAKSTRRKDRHPLKALWRILLTSLGTVKVLKLVQPSNTLGARVLSRLFSANSTVSRATQS